MHIARHPDWPAVVLSSLNTEVQQLFLHKTRSFLDYFFGKYNGFAIILNMLFLQHMDRLNLKHRLMALWVNSGVLFGPLKKLIARVSLNKYALFL